ncbi:hypothetical protein F5X96DRAFT_655958 [Biscogniauxia mediterranea]|nr:hypothetical protein F5X96DRAFT_655958 [Biscogniauxia mediterranea]
MCMHSYGGVVGTNAVAGLARKDRQAENLPGGVVHLFYLASFMLAQGQTMRSVVEKVGLVGRGSLVKIEDDGTWFPTEAIWGMYHDLEPEDQDEQVNQLVYSNICCMSSATTYEAWRYIPTTYVRTSEDRWNPPQFQDFCQANAENAGADVDVVEFKSGHSVYAKYPNELADLVAKVSNAT